MKYCKYCGNKLGDNDRFCTACGGKCEEVVEATVNENPYIECKTCGAKVDRREYSCPVCGAPLTGGGAKPSYNPNATEKSKMATAGMILGILGVTLISWLLSILGFIFGIIGLSNVNQGRGYNKGQAVAGIVLGIIGFVLSILFEIFVTPILEEYLKQLLEEMQNSGQYGLMILQALFLK